MTHETYKIRLSEIVQDIEIGIYSHEQGTTQRVGLAVDVEMVPGYGADNFLNYDVVTTYLTETVPQRRYPLQEDLAQDIASFLLGHEQVSGATINITKPDAYGPKALVGLELTVRKASHTRS